MCNDEAFAKYHATKEITTSLMIDASLHDCRVQDGRWSGLRTDVLEYSLKHYETLREIAKAVEAISAKAREFERVCWLGKIQSYYSNSTARGHSRTHDGCKMMLWGCAGRVLLTLQDKYPQSDRRAAYGGANLTLIFDETSEEARGGVQSLCATKEEALALLQAAMDAPMEFTADKAVTVGV